jgi:hypothetical protein
MPSTVLSQMVKTAAFYLVPIKSYSKNTHPPFFLKRAIVSVEVKKEEKDSIFISTRKICC